jgi:hypothetical protein
MAAGRPGILHGVPVANDVTRSDIDLLRTIGITAGIGWAIAFVVIGIGFELQLYGDGAMFSYSVAVQDAWAFHWHNISGRLTVYLLTLLPAEAYVALTGDPSGGIAVYGFLFFVAPLLGLIATFAADCSKGRVIFAYACFSTACLCPLVFGFQTEMWLAHALFWPALAVAHYARRTIGGAALVFVLLLALMLTHEGALVLAMVIVATLLLRGLRDWAFLRAAGALLVALLIWAAVKLLVPPDDYFAAVYVRAALDFFDAKIFTSDMVLLLSGTIASYAVVFLVLGRLAPAKAHVYAAAIVAVALAAYWLRLDHALHAGDRYYLRTVLVIATPTLGALAAIYALRADGRLNPPMPLLARVMEAFTSRMTTRAIAGAFVLVMLVHAVETEKFVAAWTKYKAAVVALATGAASDPALGDPHFVSSARIAADLNRLSWYSTTPYLSVILSNFAPARLVVDPRAANYFWLSCETATANLNADRAVPADDRRLVRLHACLHRPKK